MYGCMHACSYLSMSVYIYVRQLRMYVCTYVCVYIYICIYIYIYIFYVYVCMCMYIYICMYMHTCAQAHKHTHTLSVAFVSLFVWFVVWLCAAMNQLRHLRLPRRSCALAEQKRQRVAGFGIGLLQSFCGVTSPIRLAW